MKDIPSHIVNIYGTTRQFKVYKRSNIENIRRQLNSLRVGCAYMPDNSSEDIRIINDAINRLKQKCSIKNWGR